MKEIQKSYLEELRALLIGLECRNINDLLKESPDVFEALGKRLADKYAKRKVYTTILKRIIKGGNLR